MSQRDLYQTPFDIQPTPFNRISRGKYIYFPPNHLIPKRRKPPFEYNDYEPISYIKPIREKIKVAYVTQSLPEPKYKRHRPHKKYYWSSNDLSKYKQNYVRLNPKENEVTYDNPIRFPNNVYVKTVPDVTKSKVQPLKRLFDKPLIASEEAAMSYECMECDKRGMDCMLVILLRNSYLILML